MPEELINGGTSTQWHTKYTVGKMNELQLQATRMNPRNTAEWKAGPKDYT